MQLMLCLPVSSFFVFFNCDFRTYLSTSTIEIFDGDLNFDGSASLAAEQSSIVNVNGGRLTFRQDSIYSGKQSQLDISGGSVLLLNGSRIILEAADTTGLKKRSTTADLSISAVCY